MDSAKSDRRTLSKIKIGEGIRDEGEMVTISDAILEDGGKYICSISGTGKQIEYEVTVGEGEASQVTAGDASRTVTSMAGLVAATMVAVLVLV